MAYKIKKRFALYSINSLINSLFGRKSNFDNFISTFSNKLWLALAPFAFLYLISSLLVLVLAKISIYFDRKFNFNIFIQIFFSKLSLAPVLFLLPLSIFSLLNPILANHSIYFFAVIKNRTNTCNLQYIYIINIRHKTYTQNIYAVFKTYICNFYIISRHKTLTYSLYANIKY